jgi:hypothetical protein
LIARDERYPEVTIIHAPNEPLTWLKKSKPDNERVVSSQEFQGAIEIERGGEA